MKHRCKSFHLWYKHKQDQWHDQDQAPAPQPEHWHRQKKYNAKLILKLLSSTKPKLCLTRPTSIQLMNLQRPKNKIKT